jgi:hypothetical protein
LDESLPAAITPEVAGADGFDPQAASKNPAARIISSRIVLVFKFHNLSCVSFSTGITFAQSNIKNFAPTYPDDRMPAL